MTDRVVVITSKAPLLMNRYPGEKATGEKPRKKTEQYLEDQRKKRWMEAAHFAQGMFHVPPEMIEGALYAAAASFRKKTDFKKAVTVIDLFVPLLVNTGKGYQPLKGELEDFYRAEHIYIRGVPNDRGQMAEQCRPIFQDWSCEFTVRYDEQLVDEKSVRAACDLMILGSFRPRFGRVTVKHFGAIVKTKTA